MQVIKISQWVLRISAIIVLVLGILFWTNVINTDNSGGIVLVHMLLGILVVIALWTLGIAQGMRGGSFGLALATFVWGLLTLAIGLFQQKILPDPSSPHWIIQVIHLLLGLGAIGLGEMCAGRAKRQASKAVVA